MVFVAMGVAAAMFFAVIVLYRKRNIYVYDNDNSDKPDNTFGDEEETQRAVSLPSMDFNMISLVSESQLD